MNETVGLTEGYIWKMEAPNVHKFPLCVSSIVINKKKTARQDLYPERAVSLFAESHFNVHFKHL